MVVWVKTQPSLTSRVPGRPPRGFSDTAGGLGGHDGNARAVHFDVEQGHGGGGDVRQVELLGALDRHLLAGFDVGAEGLGMAFDGLGGNVETGQDVELFTALLERSFAAHQRHHAAHAGRAGGACDVEFAVTRALSPAACRAEVVGALETHLAHHGGELFGASIAVASLLTAGAGDSGRHGLGGRQQLAQQRGPGAMHGAANRRLDGFEIEGVAAALAAEDDPEQLRHFLGDFVADGFGRFFSWGVGVSSAGRRRQMLSLTSSNCRLSCWKR